MEPAVALIDHVFDPADVDVRGLHDALHLRDDLRRRRVALDAEIVLRRVYRARGPHQLRTAHGLADVGRAKIEALPSGVNPDGVEVAAAQYLDAHDALVGRRDVLLHQRSVIDPQIERTRFRGLLQLGRRLEPPDPSARAADVGLQDDGEPQALSRSGCLSRAVDHAGLGMGQPELPEQRELQRLRRFGHPRVIAIDHSHAVTLQVGKVVPRIKDRVPRPAQVRRRAHPIEHQRVWWLARPMGRAKSVPRRIEAHIWGPTADQLGEQRPEPVRVLVVASARSLGSCAHPILRSPLYREARLSASRTARSTAARSSGPAFPSGNWALVAYTPPATTVAPMLANRGRIP